MARSVENNDSITDIEHAMAVLNYDPVTGVFTWKESRGNQFAKEGGVAGTYNHDGYIRIKIRERGVFAHRLAWLFTYGDWPKSELDHINGERDDNRISNLRESNRKHNCGRAKRRVGKSGYTGVNEHPQKLHMKRRWTAYCRGKYVGLYESAYEAHLAYEEVAKRLDKESLNEKDWSDNHQLPRSQDESPQTRQV